MLLQKIKKIVQIDVLSMTDLAVNNRKMRIDLASQVFNHTIIDQQFDVVFLKAGKGAGGGGGGFGDREGRGRREEDPDAGRSHHSFAFPIFSTSIKMFRSDQSDDWRRGPPPPQREGYQVKNL